jgi:hypothetical protein
MLLVPVLLCLCVLQGTAVLRGNFDPKSMELVLSTLQVRTQQAVSLSRVHSSSVSVCPSVCQPKWSVVIAWGWAAR